MTWLETLGRTGALALGLVSLLACSPDATIGHGVEPAAGGSAGATSLAGTSGQAAAGATSSAGAGGTLSSGGSSAGGQGGQPSTGAGAGGEAGNGGQVSAGAAGGTSDCPPAEGVPASTGSCAAYEGVPVYTCASKGASLLGGDGEGLIAVGQVASDLSTYSVFRLKPDNTQEKLFTFQDELPKGNSGDYSSPYSGPAMLSGHVFTVSGGDLVLHPLAAPTTTLTWAGPAGFTLQGVWPIDCGHAVVSALKTGSGSTEAGLYMLESTQAPRLIVSTFAGVSFLSPDSLYFVEGQDLKRVPLAGGSPETLYTSPKDWNTEAALATSTHLYVTEHSNSFDSDFQMYLRRFPLTGGTPINSIQLTTETSESLVPFVFEENIYFVFGEEDTNNLVDQNYQNRLYRVPLDLSKVDVLLDWSTLLTHPNDGFGHRSNNTGLVVSGHTFLFGAFDEFLHTPSLSVLAFPVP